VYDLIASNTSNAGLQLIIIELDKNSFTLPEAYANYANVFNSDKAVKLQTQTYITHAINLENRAKTPYEPIYYLSKLKLRTLRDYLAKNE
jgi:hypothetical protein